MNATDTTLITLIGGVLVPLLVGLLTKVSASPAVKAVVNAALSAVNGAVAVAAPAGEGFVWRAFVVAWVTTFVTSAATYYGIYKPTGVAPAVANTTGNVGIG